MPKFSPKRRISSTVALCLLVCPPSQSEPKEVGQDQTAFTSFRNYKDHIEAGGIPSYYGQTDRERLIELLSFLRIPSSSQLLVFSTTSLQLSKISPGNPRAIYFNDNLYLGYVPGGQIEVIEVDKEEGILPYIFSLPPSRSASHPQILQSDRCMRCHDSDKTGFVPGLLLESVVPQKGGGTLDRLITNSVGHQIPYENRFGGWFLTGSNQYPGSWANSLGSFVRGKLRRDEISPNHAYLKHNYPQATSEAVAHAILSHQIGFTNQCIRLGFLHEDGDEKSFEQALENLIGYTLFVDEANLPTPLRLDVQFAKEFEASFPKSPPQYNLKTLNLRNRLFEIRCSYMLLSKAFQNLPSALKQKFFARLRQILLDPGNNLSEVERKRIHEALNFHLPLYRKMKKAP